MRANPEYEAVALTNRFRMVFSGTNAIEVEGVKYAQDSDRPNTNFELVTGSFFDVTKQKLLEGRTFTDQDLDSHQPVAVVNAAFARKHFGNQSALNRRFRTAGNPGPASPWRTIVGVVSTVRMAGPFNNPGVDESGFYVPFYASVVGPTPPTPLASQFATLLVRPRGGPVEPLANSLRKEVAKLDPNLPLYFVGTPQSQLLGFVAQNRIIATMFTVFGVVAVLLAAVGIYGVMSFSVNQRTQEFGVRMALGAGRGRILAMVMRQSAIQIIIGGAVGAVLTMGLAALAGAGIQNILFNVNPRDPVIYGAVLGLIAAGLARGDARTGAARDESRSHRRAAIRIAESGDRGSGDRVIELAIG